MKTIQPTILAVVLLVGYATLSPPPAQAQHFAGERGRFPTGSPTTPPQAKNYHRSTAFRADRHTHDLGILPAETIAEAEAAHAQRFARIHPGPERIGVCRTFGDRPIALQAGAAQRFAQADGSSVWLWAVRSPGAHGLRLHFKGFDAGSASVLAFAEGKTGLTISGPYSGRGPDKRGEFWTEPLPGELVFVEVTARGEPRLEVDEVLHLDRDIFAAVSPPDLLPCHLDVMCYGTDRVNPIARDATVLLTFNCRLENGITVCASCTGTLLADLDGDTTVPYLLTAYHCLSTQAEVDSLTVTFFWQKSECDGSLPSSPPTMSGGKLLELSSTDEGNDMTFIRLNGALPVGVAFAAWNAGDVPYNVYGIHHPKGDWKRVTFSVTDPTLACQLQHDEDEFHFILENDGRTQKGSSGSALFDEQGRVVGQLRGACWGAFGNSPDCGDSDNWRDSYGKFSQTYPRIRHWLEIGGTINVNRAYNGDERGTPTQPFNTVTEGYNLAWDDTRIKIKPGTYSDRLTLDKRLTLIADGGPVTIGQ